MSVEQVVLAAVVGVGSIAAVFGMVILKSVLGTLTKIEEKIDKHIVDKDLHVDATMKDTLKDLVRTCNKERIGGGNLNG